MFFNNKFNTFFGLNLTLVYTFPMCMVWRFHFQIHNYDFKNDTVISVACFNTDVRFTEHNENVTGDARTVRLNCSGSSDHVVVEAGRHARLPPWPVRSGRNVW